MIIIVAQAPSSPSLSQQLMQLRPQMAAAAQAIYDTWTQNESGVDEELGSGGICDQVSNKLGEIVSLAIECDIEDGGQDGDDHAFLVVSRGSEKYMVDIPYQIYERGGGYSWTKIPNVRFSPEHVEIFPIKM